MKKAFLSIILILSFLPFLFLNLKAYNEVFKGIQAMRNELILQQKINEKSYDLENGFTLTVKDALNELTEGTDDFAAVHVCRKIDEWSEKYSDVEFSVGYVNVNDYTESTWGLGKNILDILTLNGKELFKDLIVGPCINFLEVREGKARVKEKQLIDYLKLGFNPANFTDFDAAFVFKSSAYKSRFKVLIPRETEICVDK